MNRTFMIAAVICLGLTAGACDSGGRKGNTQPPPPPPPPPPPAAFAENFGAGFAEAFERDAFDEPRQVQAGDIIAVSFTDDPLQVPDDAG